MHCRWYPSMPCSRGVCYPSMPCSRGAPSSGGCLVWGVCSCWVSAPGGWPGGDSPRQPLLWAVCILLECILVVFYHPSKKLRKRNVFDGICLSVCVCVCVGGGGSLYRAPALFPPLYRVLAPSQTCLNLYNLDVNVQGLPDMVKLV